MSRKSAVKAYTLRVELQDIEPLVWRRLLVDGDTTLGKLHHYIQEAMGWTDSRCGRACGVARGSPARLRLRVSGREPVRLRMLAVFE